MKSRWTCLLVVCGVALWGTWARAEGVAKPWSSSLTVGANATDNRDGLKDDEESNVDVFMEPRMDYLLRFDQGRLDFFLAPAVKWHSNPRSTEVAGERTDAQNEFELFGKVGADLAYQLARRLGLKVGDTLIYTDDPEITEGGTSVRRSASHWLNRAYGELGAEVTPKVAGQLKGQVVTKRYDEESVAEYEDEDAVSGELGGKYLMGSGFNLLGFVGYADFENKSPEWDRGSQIASVGAGVEKTFSPDLQGRLVAGYQHAEYDAADLDARDGVMAQADLALRTAAALRFKISGQYGFFGPYVRPYSLQKLIGVSGGAEYDLTSRIMLTARGQYTDGEYEAEGTHQGGNDRMSTVGVGGVFKVNRNVAVGLNYDFEDWDSEIPEREPFQRNTVSANVTARF
mgnify:CR=1 FL=1